MQVTTRTEQPLVVQIGERVVEGWLIEPACPHCQGPRVYFLAFEATCCPACNVWLELLCPEPECIHCEIRPDQPFSSA